MSKKDTNKSNVNCNKCVAGTIKLSLVVDVVQQGQLR